MEWSWFKPRNAFDGTSLMWLKRRSLKGNFFHVVKISFVREWRREGKKSVATSGSSYQRDCLCFMPHTHFSLRDHKGIIFIWHSFLHRRFLSFLFFVLSARQDELNNFLLLPSSGLEGAAGRGVKMLRNESIRDRRFNLAQNVTAETPLEWLLLFRFSLSHALSSLHNVRICRQLRYEF